MMQRKEAELDERRAHSARSVVSDDDDGDDGASAADTEQVGLLVEEEEDDEVAQLRQRLLGHSLLSNQQASSDPPANTPPPPDVPAPPRNDPAVLLPGQVDDPDDEAESEFDSFAHAFEMKEMSVLVQAVPSAVVVAQPAVAAAPLAAVAAAPVAVDVPLARFHARNHQRYRFWSRAGGYGYKFLPTFGLASRRAQWIQDHFYMFVLAWISLIALCVGVLGVHSSLTPPVAGVLAATGIQLLTATKMMSWYAMHLTEQLRERIHTHFNVAPIPDFVRDAASWAMFPHFTRRAGADEHNFPETLPDVVPPLFLTITLHVCGALFRSLLIAGVLYGLRHADPPLNVYITVTVGAAILVAVVELERRAYLKRAFFTARDELQRLDLDGFVHNHRNMGYSTRVFTEFVWECTEKAYEQAAQKGARTAAVAANAPQAPDPLAIT
jgi:hypothetical protein